MSTRLTMLTMVVLLLMTPVRLSPQESGDMWINEHVKYETSENPFGDSPKIHAILVAEYPRGVNRMDEGVLIVRCKDGKKEVFLSGAYFGETQRTVRWKFDDGEIHATTWKISTDGDAVLAPRGVGWGIINEAKNASKVHFQVTDYNGTPHTYSIPLAGFDKAVERGMPCL